jgi:hypothetical protein
MKDGAPLKMLFVSFANQHSTAVRKINQARKSRVDLSIYDTKIDKNRTTMRSRLLSGCYFRLFAKLIFSDANVWWLWGADACFIGSVAGVFRPSKAIIWDISDIHVAMLGESLSSRILRKIERMLIKRSNRLILSSGAFWTYHYKGWLPQKRVFVIENLLEGQPQKLHREAPEKVLNVIYSGILRSDKLLALITDCARLCEGKVIFHLWGFFDVNVKQKVIEDIEESPYVRFHGEYPEEALPEIFADMHVTFGLVDVDADDNERWLLSNRLYQAGAFKCPIVSTKDSNVGKETISRRVGWVVDNDCLQLTELLRDLSEDKNKIYSSVLGSMPDESEFYFGEEYAHFFSSLQP